MIYKEIYMKKISVFFVFTLLALTSISHASPGKGVFLKGNVGLGAFTDSDADPGGMIGFGIGYGLSDKLALAGTLNILVPESEGFSIMYVIVGGNILYFPVKDKDLYIGFHLGIFNAEFDPADENMDTYSLESYAIGPRIGYELDLTGNVSAGFDLSYLMIGSASTTFSAYGLTTEIESEENGLISLLVYLKYYFGN